MNNAQQYGVADKRLVAEGLSCRRGGRTVFEGLGFELGAGDYLQLKGKNGSGKSTLLRLLAGLLPSRTGSVSFGAEKFEGADVALSSEAIYLGHQHALKPVLTLQENCENFFQLMAGSTLGASRLETAAEAFGLTNLIDMPVRLFSSGQTHRCALLRFLLLDRPIWMMDEPTVGLDSENRLRLEAVMKSHLSRGGILIAATHDPIDVAGKVLELADFQAKLDFEGDWL
ncbi:MAG: heme ABC exporter ATP-binding protein CcmA [Kordiimonadales bacterium]|nr:MAG: heme ABC exporter ATP-binding protein CcmA [Kordiimonadales bacterium]